LYDFGLYVFVLLYNLYLLDLGYREDFLGAVTSAMTFGSLAGALPAAAVVRRFGLKRTLIGGSAGVAFMCGLRTLPLGHQWFIATAFLAGIISSIWAVSLVPVVAALTSQRIRAAGYSLWTGWGIGLGVICGALAGSLPGWILALGLATSNKQAKQMALLFGAVVALLSPLLLVRLPLPHTHDGARKIFPRSPFVTRYLFAFAIWNFALGAFNPFFTAYFSRHLHMPDNQIGFVFSASQFAELCALLAAPVLLRRFGMVVGISMMQAGVALALALLATGPQASLAGILYAAYGSLQYMSEPGTFTLLMSRVSPNDRAGVSAMMFFVMSGSQAVAAALAGISIIRIGYPLVLASSSAVAALSAYLFRHLLSAHDLADSGDPAASPEHHWQTPASES